MAEKEKIPELTLEQRAIRVLVSQGYAPTRLASLPQAVQIKLEDLCDGAGNLSPNTRQAVKELMNEYFQSQKAVVDKVEVRGFGVNTTTTVGIADGTLVPDWKTEPT